MTYETPIVEVLDAAELVEANGAVTCTVCFTQQPNHGY